VIVEATTSEWEFAIAPYLWAAGISGTTAQFGLPEIDIDASFSEIWDHLDFAAMVVSEFRRGRVGVFSDFAFVKLSGAAGTPRGILADEADVDILSLDFTLAPEYRVIEVPRASLDLMAGARLWSVSTDISFDGGVLDGVSRDDGDTWVDPLVGVKGRFDLTDHLYVSAWGLIGGFGVSSDFMWDAWGGLGYQFNNTISAVVGYRGTGVDFEHGGFSYDVIQHGPVIGAVFRF
jgi:hypothetical protein